MALVLDTGVLYAALDEHDPDHEACTQLLSSMNEDLVIPEPVLVELDYWVRKFASPDAWLVFCEDIASGAYTLFCLNRDSALAAARLEASYTDLRLGFVDAAVFVVVEALGETKVATLDHRHFSTLRTARGRALTLLPE